MSYMIDETKWLGRPGKLTSRSSTALLSGMVKFCEEMSLPCSWFMPWAEYEFGDATIPHSDMELCFHVMNLCAELENAH